MNNNKLIKKVDIAAAGNLPEEFRAMASNVEDALIISGGVPGEDYSLLDLFTLAAPLTAALIEKNRITEYDYHADKIV